MEQQYVLSAGVDSVLKGDMLAGEGNGIRLGARNVFFADVIHDGRPLEGHSWLWNHECALAPETVHDIGQRPEPRRIDGGDRPMRRMMT
jgi:hypothetical protein